MPEAKHGTFYWNELMTRDVEAAVQFYKDVIGWSFDEVPMGDGVTYYVGKLDDQPVGGMMAMLPDMPEGTPPHWLGYLAVDDVLLQPHRLRLRRPRRLLQQHCQRLHPLARPGPVRHRR